MKLRIPLWALSFLFFGFFGLYGQDKKFNQNLNENLIKGYFNLEVSYFKTVHIIFPNRIKYVDVGSESIAAAYAENVDNVVKLKANSAGFAETNLTVITEDGSFFSFVCRYKENPFKLAFEVSKEVDKMRGKEKGDIQDNSKSVGNSVEKKKSGTGKLNRDNIVFSSTTWGLDELNVLSENMIKLNTNAPHLGMKTGKMDARLYGIYSKENLIFTVIKVKNQSALDYKIDFIKSFVSDKEKSKKVSFQEYEIPILYSYWDRGDMDLIPHGGETYFVFITEKVPIQEEKVFRFNFNEFKGGRNLAITLDYRAFNELMKPLK